MKIKLFNTNKNLLYCGPPGLEIKPSFTAIDSDNIILSTNNLTLNKNGITSLGLRNSQIYNNTIESNINRGLSLVYSDNNLITYNHIENNRKMQK